MFLFVIISAGQVCLRNILEEPGIERYMTYSHHCEIHDVVRDEMNHFLLLLNSSLNECSNENWQWQRQEYRGHFTPHGQRTQSNVIQRLKEPQLTEIEAMANIWKCLSTPSVQNKAFYNIHKHWLSIPCTKNTHHLNYNIPRKATVIKFLNFAFDKLWYRDKCNQMEYTRNVLT